jgi:hypothetical protein
MLKEEQNLKWRALVKGIFESKAKLAENAMEEPKLDMPQDGAEDPVDAPPVDGEAPPEGLDGDVEGGEEEEVSPSITITADCLLQLFEYFQSPNEESSEDGEDSLDIDGGDDVIGAQDTLTDTPPEGSEELTPEQVVQKLITASEDNDGAPLDVDCLASVFSPEEGGEEELGDGSDLATNTEEIPGEDNGEAPALPATTGKMTSPLAEDSSNVSGGELERKNRALASLEARLKSANSEDASDIRDDIASVKSQIAKLKTKGITTAQGHKHAADAKAGHKDDADA